MEGLMGGVGKACDRSPVSSDRPHLHPWLGGPYSGASWRLRRHWIAPPNSAMLHGEALRTLCHPHLPNRTPRASIVGEVKKGIRRVSESCANLPAPNSG